MSVPRWIWKLNTTGIVAVSNLTAFGICLLMHVCLFGTGSIHVDREPAWKLLTDDILTGILIVLTSPLGWIAEYNLGLHSGPDLLTIVCIPANAYFWGFCVFCWRRIRNQA